MVSSVKKSSQRWLLKQKCEKNNNVRINGNLNGDHFFRGKMYPLFLKNLQSIPEKQSFLTETGFREQYNDEFNTK